LTLFTIKKGMAQERPFQVNFAQSSFIQNCPSEVGSFQMASSKISIFEVSSLEYSSF